MGYTRNPGKGESDSSSKTTYSRTGKHDVKDSSGGQSQRYTHFLKTGDPGLGGSRAGRGLAPEARSENRATAKASAGGGQVGLVYSKTAPSTPSGTSYGYKPDESHQGRPPWETIFVPHPTSKYSYKQIEDAKTQLKLIRDVGKYVKLPLSIMTASTAMHSPLAVARPVVEDISTEDVAPYVEAAFVGVDVVSGGKLTDIKEVYTDTSEFISGGITKVTDTYTEIIKQSGDLGDIYGEVKDWSKIALLGLAAVAVIMLAK